MQILINGGVILNYIKDGGPLRGYWYLKCLFIYLVVNYLLVILTKNLPLSVFISIALFLFLPNINFSKMMIAFFGLGVFYEDLSKRFSKKTLLIIASAAMIICYLFLDIKATYLGSSRSLWLYIQFLMNGISASLFWITLFELMIPQKSSNKVISFLQQIGTLSLGIYCIHEFFYFEKLYRPVLEKFNMDNAFIQIAYSFIILVVSFIFIRLISCNKYTSLLFLGRSYPKTKRYMETHF